VDQGFDTMQLPGGPAQAIWQAQVVYCRRRAAIDNASAGAFV